MLLSRWIVEKKDIMKGKVVVELGAGCGLPALAAGDFIAQILCDYVIFEHFIIFPYFLFLTLFPFISYLRNPSLFVKLR